MRDASRYALDKAFDDPQLPARPRLAEAGARAPAQPQDLVVGTRHGDIAVRQSQGTGLPILMLHGNSCGKDVFREQFDSPLGQEHRLIALDLPGHGASQDAPDPQASYTVPGYADAVIEVLEILGLDQIAVFGWSLGGHVALEMSARYPDLVGVMITGTPPLGHDATSEQEAFYPHPLALMAGSAVLSDEQVVAFARAATGLGETAAAEAMIRRTDGRAREIMVRSLRAGAFTDERALVETSTTPIAVVHGSDDPMVKPSYLSKLRYGNLWSGRVHLIPRAGHAPFLDSAPLFNHLLATFIADMKARGQMLAASPTLAYSA